MNPLLIDFKTPFDTAPFDKIKTENYLPAIKAAIEEAKSEIAAIKKVKEIPTFQNTIEALEAAGARLDRISSIFFNLNSAETNDETQKLAREISPLLTTYSNDIMLDQELFDRVKSVYDQIDKSKLSIEQQTLLDKTYKGFARNGALLDEKKKERLRAIDNDLAQLSLKFGENVLAETNRYELILEDVSDLAGLPQDEIDAAAELASERGHEGKWAVTLAYPSYIPFMTYAQNRALREKLFMAYNTKCLKGDEFDNTQVIKDMIRLRHERAKLLGYDSYADFVLEERMAEKPKKVTDFLSDMLEKAKPVALKEMQELQDFARKMGGPEKLQKWDLAFYAEKLKKEKFAIDDELLKPYFKLENVIEGVFLVAGKLYDLQFKENKDIPVYHPEVKAYEVSDSKGKHIAVFYADFFPRAGKRNGAWMTSYRGQNKRKEQEQRPHISIVCNFTKPTSTKPSLLTFNEVTTLFHEFGHALHGMLADGHYESLSGTNVYWDFVELPSQIFENWCYEKEALDLFAKHYETGEAISEDLVERIKASANFHAGYQTIRQLSFGILDMTYHSIDPKELKDILAFEEATTREANVLPNVSGTAISPSFSHIFQGGYAAGYYSYKWAEVLDADAFEYFLEAGIFDPKVSQLFKEHILSAGGREHPMTLYKRFRGREPKPEALLRRAGLLKAS